MNRPGQQLEAQPAPSSAPRRIIGEIWREGGAYFEQTAAGPWPLPFVTTFIEREDRTELLRFGLCLRGYDPGRLDMPLLSSDGATPDEVCEARVMCFDEERYTIKDLLHLDDVEFLQMVRSFQ